MCFVILGAEGWRDVSRVSYLPLSGVCMYVCVSQGSVWQKVTSLYLFWLTDKYYIVIGFFKYYFFFWEVAWK